MYYRAEYQNEEIAIIVADGNDEAISEASRYEEDNGLLWNVYLLDENWNDIECIF